MKRCMSAWFLGAVIPASAGTLTYTYDDAGRLTQASGPQGSRTYQLDPAGNRSGVSLQAGLGGAAPPSMTTSADSAPSNDGAPSALASANETGTRSGRP